MKPELKKLLLLNLPYLLFVYLFAKCGQAYRLAAGADASAKLLHLTGGISVAFASPLPSLHLFDTVRSLLAHQKQSPLTSQNICCPTCRRHRVCIWLKAVRPTRRSCP